MATTTIKKLKGVNTDHKIYNIYRSRQTLIQYLENENYNCENFKNFTLNDINNLFNTSQLDLLVYSNNEDSNNKAFIKYSIEKPVKQSDLYMYIEELYNVEDILNTNDNFVIIVYDKPNDTIIQTLKNIWEQENIFITILDIKSMLFNILEHVMVPKHIKLNDNEKDEVKNKYNMEKDNEFPEISRFDPVAKILFLRPGQVCKIKRYNKTSITENYYRICIP